MNLILKIKSEISYVQIFGENSAHRIGVYGGNPTESICVPKIATGEITTLKTFH